MAELLNMVVEGWLPLLVVSWIAVQDGILSDEPTLHFAQPDFVAEFSRLIDLSPPNNVSVGFKDTD